MDADRFDILARSLRAPHTRRGVMRVLGGMALGPLALLGIAQTEAKRKRKKKKKPPPASVVYVPVPAGDCPDGYTMCNGVCRDLLFDPKHCGRCGRDCGSADAPDGATPRQCCEGRCQNPGCCRNSDCPRAGDVCSDGFCVTGAGTCSGSLDSCSAVGRECTDERTPGTSCVCRISTENELRCGRIGPRMQPIPPCNDSLDCQGHGFGAFCSRADCAQAGGGSPDGQQKCFISCYP